MTDLKSSLNLKEPLKNPFVLAPLAGVTDSAFRQICFAQGASLAYTEMVSAKGLYYRSRNTADLLKIDESEGPVGVQLFGSDPAMLSFAAKHIAGLSNRFIDINMGCPVPKVVKNGEGSALLKDKALAASLVRAAREGGKPVTVKMRIGFSESEDIHPEEFARTMEEAGAALIAVHGRTREQYYSGKADWEVIGRVTRSVKIPVAGNGDVFSAEDAMRLLDKTGCSLVMIARGSLGNPWIFRECDALYHGKAVPPRPETDEIIETVKKHALLLLADKEEHRAVREMRKHAAWYTKGIKGAAEIRRKASGAESLDELFCIIEGLKTIAPEK